MSQLGIKPFDQSRVLLTGVFGPYAQDDEYGSRAINPMELYHNQVTRVQGPFSLRMFHRSGAAARHYYRRDPALRAKISELLGDMFREFGWTSRLFAAVGGPYVYWNTRREEKRLSRGWTYEPPTFYEHNDAAHALNGNAAHGAAICASVTPRLTATGDKIAPVDDPVNKPRETPAPAPVDACPENIAS